MPNKTLSYIEVLSMHPNDLTTWTETFKVEIPSSIESVEDMQHAARLLSKLTNIYSYFMSLDVYAKIAVRNEKKKGKDNKEMYELMVDRQYAIKSACETAKMAYNCLSRLITIKQEINKEINMSNNSM